MDGEGIGQDSGMVFVWGSGWGPRRRRGYGPPPGYGRGWGPPPGYGYRRGYGGGGGNCLRDLFLIETGCCLAELLGCGPQLVFLAPAAVREIQRAPRRPLAERLVAAVRAYQREISPRRPPCCRYEPTCSAYAVQALERHGARRGTWLTLRRLLRCRPGVVGGLDTVPE